MSYYGIGLTERLKYWSHIGKDDWYCIWTRLWRWALSCWQVYFLFLLVG